MVQRVAPSATLPLSGLKTLVSDGVRVAHLTPAQLTTRPIEPPLGVGKRARDTPPSVSNPTDSDGRSRRLSSRRRLDTRKTGPNPTPHRTAARPTANMGSNRRVGGG